MSNSVGPPGKKRSRAGRGRNGNDALTVEQIIGRNVAVWRRALGLTQAGVAEEMNRLGFDSWLQQTAQQVEAGTRALAWDELLVLCAFFGISPANMLAPNIGDSPDVLVAGKRLPWHAWMTWMRWTDDAPMRDRARESIDSLVQGAERPWEWLRGSLGEAVLGGREKVLARRDRFPGPTYVLTGDAPMRLVKVLPPLGQELTILLKPGIPYVCRDEAEAQELERWVASGEVRRVNAREAYRIRERVRKQAKPPARARARRTTTTRRKR